MNMYVRKIEVFETNVNKLDDLKNDFGDPIAATFAKNENMSEFWKGQCEHTLNDNTAKISPIFEGAAAKLNLLEEKALATNQDLDAELQMLYFKASKKFMGTDDAITNNIGAEANVPTYQDSCPTR